MEARCHAVLDAAWAAGVRYFDAARSYGRAEEFLGHWLRSRNISPISVTVGSKWGYTYTANWRVAADKHEIKDHSLPVLRRQYQESRQFLGEYLKLYQIHSATLESGVLDNTEVLSELAQMKAAGLKIGLSLSGPGQTETLRQALSISLDGQRLFDCVQATWNLLERSAGPVLQEAHEAGLGVIIKEALANGRLTERSNSNNFAQQKYLLEQAATQHSTTLDALALAAVLAQPWVDVVLSGAARPEHLLSNLQALAIRWDKKTEDILRETAENKYDYWQTRSQLAWN
jgi:aryl-alcohol dehydrogenase-like predicted oxidoreductase